ncbi:MAG: hypothetical protein ABIH11_02485 [Candidatus Altiarchaeota archaeon]
MDCNFCERKIPKGSEVIYVTKKGKALYLCSSKCENNMVKLKRKARKTKWTAEYRREKDARLKLLEQARKDKKTVEPKKEEKAEAAEEDELGEEPKEVKKAAVKAKKKTSKKSKK